MNYLMCASRPYKDTVQSVTVTYRKAPDGEAVYEKMMEFVNATKTVHVPSPSYDFKIQQFTKVDDGRTHNISQTATAYISARSKTASPSTIAIRLNGITAETQSSAIITNLKQKYDTMIENSLGDDAGDSYDIISIIYEIGG